MITKEELKKWKEVILRCCRQRYRCKCYKGKEYINTL